MVDFIQSIVEHGWRKFRGKRLSDKQVLDFTELKYELKSRWSPHFIITSPT
jgi:hypothetical protein